MSRQPQINTTVVNLLNYDRHIFQLARLLKRVAIPAAITIHIPPIPAIRCSSYRWGLTAVIYSPVSSSSFAAACRVRGTRTCDDYLCSLMLRVIQLVICVFLTWSTWSHNHVCFTTLFIRQSRLLFHSPLIFFQLPLLPPHLSRHRSRERPNAWPVLGFEHGLSDGPAMRVRDSGRKIVKKIS